MEEKTEGTFDPMTDPNELLEPLTIQGPAQQAPEYKRWVLSALYGLILTTWFFDNIDHGALPAGSTAIREDMNMDNAQYGFLGSIVFGGLALGKSA